MSAHHVTPHLTRLARLDFAVAILDAVLAVGLGTGAVGLAVWAHGRDKPEDVAIWLGLGAVLFVLLMAGAAFFAVLGRQVRQGRWRIAQTVAGVFWLGAWPPLGLLVGGYMLWVCWGDPASKARFEGLDAAGSASIG